MIAVIDILRNNATVSTLIGGTDARVYPALRPQGSSLPGITVATDDNEPSDTKDGPSKLDTETVIVTSFAKTAATALELGSAVRTALDRTKGVYNGVTVQSIRYVTESFDYESEANNLIYWMEQIYDVRIEK